MKELLKLLKLIPCKKGDSYMQFAMGSHEYEGKFFKDLVKAFKNG